MGENAAVSNPYAPPSGDRPRPEPQRPGPPPVLPPAPGRYARSGQEHRAPAPPQAPPDPAQVARASRQVVHFGLFMLGAIALSALELPWKVAAIVFLAAAVVTGIRALVTVLRARVRGMLVPMLAVGLVAAGLLSLTLLATFATWPLQMKQQDCLRGALTISAQAECQQSFQQGLLTWEKQLQQRSTGG